MATHNHAEAYDLSAFEPHSNIVPLRPNKKEQKREQQKTKVQKIINGVIGTLTTAIIMIVVALLIATRIQLTELNNRISNRQTELNTAVGETMRLRSELAAQTSAQSVEAYANANDMQSIQSSQITYITVEEPAATANTKPESFFESLWHTVTSFFTGS